MMYDVLCIIIIISILSIVIVIIIITLFASVVDIFRYKVSQKRILQFSKHKYGIAVLWNIPSASKGLHLSDSFAVVHNVCC